MREDYKAIKFQLKAFTAEYIFYKTNLDINGSVDLLSNFFESHNNTIDKAALKDLMQLIQLNQSV